MGGINLKARAKKCVRFPNILIPSKMHVPKFQRKARNFELNSLK
jgi:hypothetical protein